uniref:protein CFAP20DC isoform X1 n=2 Tax=Jaculus jaculus TaxID=51337 RepID=UPI001E1B1962|nr:protein CFAP20DC isoform X1 [Jaculus jaculus]
MFKNEYQGGAFVEIFSAQGKNPGAKWKILGSPSVIWKEFDKEVKSFVFVLEGSSQTNKIQLPQESRQKLGLIQRFLVLQIYLPLGQDFSTELLITDLRNIKRRLYLSTVHKELSSTPLHAKIPLLMVKRKIWCNLCIDLVAFTSEIFKGAVFQSLDGITVSANCKLRKIFTLKSKPHDAADKDGEPTGIIPRSCQLPADVPHMTQLLNMTKLHQIQCGGHPLRSAESDQFINRGAGSARSSRSQDVCHIAFGSKVLGPPPLSSRRHNLRLSSETVRSTGSKNSQLCQQPATEKCVSAKGSGLLTAEPEKQGGKGSPGQTQTVLPPVHLPTIHPHPPQEPLGDKNNHRRRFRLKSASKERTETPTGSSSTNKSESEGTPFPAAVTQLRTEPGNPSAPEPQTPEEADEWIFPENDEETPHPLLLGEDSGTMSYLWPESSKDSDPDRTEDTQMAPKDIFTFSSRPRSAPHGKTQTLSPEQSSLALDLKEEEGLTRDDTQLAAGVCGDGGSAEEYNWRNYEASQMSESEWQMLASLRRQQNEELEEPRAPHGLSASQVDNCNVSVSTSSDDTTTWNSCLPPPVNQGRHYQKEMNPPSPSNPRDWLRMLSPPIVPPSQQPVEQLLESSGSLSAQGEEDLSVEEDEEVLTLLYDPCLNCYFDPQTGKYYELV